MARCYKQTVIGAAWAVLQPLLTVMMFTMIFTIVESNFYGTGKIPWSGLFVLPQRWQLK